jgi:hypothetical protein
MADVGGAEACAQGSDLRHRLSWVAAFGGRRKSRFCGCLGDNPELVTFAVERVPPDWSQRVRDNHDVSRGGDIASDVRRGGVRAPGASF